MTRYSKSLLRLSAVAAAVIAPPAFAAATFDANAEFDTTYVNKANGGDSAVNDTLRQGGRIEVNFAGKTTVGSGFVAGRGTAILGNGGAATTDDAWVQGGSESFSVKVGRFESTDLSPPGRDVYVIGSSNHGIGYNGNQVAWTRTGQPRITLNGDFGGGVTFEFGIQEENTGTNVKGTDNPTLTNPLGGTSKAVKIAVRPVVSFAAGPISARVGLEKSGLPDTKVGIAGTFGYNFGDGNVNVNLGSQGKSTPNGETSSSYGFQVNGGYGPFGAAYLQGRDHFSRKGKSLYLTYQMPFFIDKANFIIALAKGHAPGAPTETGLRARIHYDF